MGKGQSHPVDVHVGKVIRAERQVRGITQSALGEHLGVAFQQVQKYERGTNRLSASMLLKIAVFFDVDPGVFFPRRNTTANGHDDAIALMTVPGAPKLVKAFSKLDPRTQAAAAASMSVFAEKLIENGHK
jgi:transcriptional regulator with XRE-family HTH domain